MSRLEIRLLGSPSVTLAGRPLGFKTRKALALLAYLAVEKGSHSRERLVALLWPESEEEQGRASLRSALAFLRSELEGYLLATRESVAFDPQSDFNLDLSAFEWTVKEGEPEAAAQLYRGEFMQGFTLADAPEFEDWLTVQREAARRQMDGVLSGLLERYAEAGDSARSLETAQRRLGMDPLNEEAVRALLRLHLAAGNPSEAQSVYYSFKSRLEREIGAKPEPATEALLAQAQTALPRRPNRVPSLPTLLLEGRMVGRVAEHVKLVEAYHTAALGRPQVAVLEGEPGIGKTRLAQEFLNWAGAQGAEVLRGRAFETGGALAYGPVVDALRRKLRGEDPRALLGEVWLAELSRLLPELPERVPGLPAPTADEGLARTRLFEAVTRLGTRLGQGLSACGPLVFFLDDLQWADSASLELLAYAARRWLEEELPVLLLFTVRSEALGTTALTAWLASLGRELPLLRLSLGALSLADTEQLLQVLTGEAQNLTPFARWLHAETGGQPLFIGETLKSLAERGLLQPKAGGGWSVQFESVQPEERRGFVAPGVRSVIQARLSRLSPLALELVEAGAVLGQGFSFAQLHRVADVPEREALPALDELLRGRLLLETGGTYAFSHDRLREVAYAEAGEARRRVFHARALTVLAGAQAAALALHAQAAGLDAEAYRYSVAAGDEASRVYAWQAAAEHYERAWEIGRRILGAGVEIAELAVLVGKLSNRYATLNEWVKRGTLAKEAVRVAQTAGDPRLEARALGFLAGQYEVSNPERARDLFRQAQTIAEREADEELLLTLKISLSYLEDSPVSQDRSELSRLEELLPAARKMGREYEVWCMSRIAALRQYSGDWAEAVEAWKATLALGGTSADGRAYALENLGLSALSLGHLEEALEALREAYRLKTEFHDNPTFIAVAGAFLTSGLLEAGQIEAALELAEQSYRLGQPLTNVHQFRVFYGFALGEARQAAGRLEAARAAFEEALAVVADTPPSLSDWAQSFRDFLHSHLCANAALVGDWERAALHARAALQARRQTGNVRGIHAPRLARWLETEALLRAGEKELAREGLERLEAAIQPGERLALPYLRARAVLEAWEGKPEEARRSLEEARALAAGMGLVGELESLEGQQAALATPLRSKR